MTRPSEDFIVPGISEIENLDIPICHSTHLNMTWFLKHTSQVSVDIRWSLQWTRIRTDSLFRIRIFGWIRSDSLWGFRLHLGKFLLLWAKWIRHWFTPTGQMLLANQRSTHSGKYTNLYWVSGLIAPALGGNMLLHSVWVSTNAFLGCTPDPRHISCGDDSDGLSCIPLPVSHKHRHYRHHRHLKQASRFNLRLACFVFELCGKAFVPKFSELDLDIL